MNEGKCESPIDSRKKRGDTVPCGRAGVAYRVVGLAALPVVLCPYHLKLTLDKGLGVERLDSLGAYPISPFKPTLSEPSEMEKHLPLFSGKAEDRRGRTARE